MSRGSARWMSKLWTARLTEPVSKQSRDRMPLDTVVKAKLAALKRTCIVRGVGMFTSPKRLMYCSHRLKACSAAKACVESSLGEIAIHQHIQAFAISASLLL